MQPDSVLGTLVTNIVRAPPEANPKTRIQLQVAYLGGDPMNTNCTVSEERREDVRQSMKGSE